MSRRLYNKNGRKHNVHCVKPGDPPFLRAIKERCGYKEGPNVNTKRPVQRQDFSDSDEEEKGDERPQVVVLRDGDLSQEEASKLLNKTKDESKRSDTKMVAVAEDTAQSNRRVVFSSSSKRTKDVKETLKQMELSSKKKKLQEDCSRKKDVKAVKDNRLLSFGDDEEEV
ncbi:uncharacterized protein KIAA1143 homolog [Varroa destructor]|uniref:DUF4604 domain-containing protein n=1 Tax=Varroa destructor TaxID=109461 RepID=A0A7M7KP92_VARDE|nr:uncharacterized protein KIAA1143 homolog [Varroa destructor]